MNKIIGKILFNNNFIEPENYQLKGNYVYEVIRIINSKVLFFEEHFIRLFNSLNLAFSYNKKPNLDKIRSDLEKLIINNKIVNGNIKIDAFFDEELKIFYYQIKSVYPNQQQYTNGVNTVFQFSERENPNAKIGNFKLKNEAKKLINEKNVYETILVNAKNEVTEGSRSNLFFIKEGTIFSPPSELILKGITRYYLIKLFDELELNFKEKRIKTKDLSNYDSAFLSGTSPVILPIKSIEEINFDVNNKILRKLMQEFIPRVLS